MRTIGKVLAFVVVCLFVITLPLSIFVFDVGSVLFDAPRVKAILTDVFIDSDLIPVGLQWYAEQRARAYASDEDQNVQSNPNVLVLLEHVELDGWREIRQAVLPDPILESWITVSVDEFYTWLDSDALLPDIVWDLAPFKEQVASPAGSDAVQVVFDSLPPCTDEQISAYKARLAAAPPGVDVPYDLCRFPDPWFADQVSDYHASLGIVLEQIPDTLDLAAELPPDALASGMKIDQLKLQLQLMRSAMRWAPLWPAILILLVLALPVRSLRELGRWWGIPLMIGGGGVVAIGLIRGSLMLTLMSFGPLSDLPMLVRTEILNAFSYMMSGVLRPMLWQGCVLLFLGLVLLVVGVLVKPASPEAA